MEKEIDRNMQIFEGQDVIEAELYGVSPHGRPSARVKLGAYVSVKAPFGKFIGHLIRLEMGAPAGVEELLATFETEYGNLTIVADEIESIEVL